MKKVICVFLFVLFFLSNAVADQPYRVFDNAGLCTDEENEKIKERIVEFRQKHKIDFSVLTTNDLITYDKQDLIAAIFYESMEIGVGQHNDGAVLFIDAYTGRHFILPQGNLLVDVAITMEDLTEINKESNAIFQEGRFYEGIIHAIDMLDSYIDEYWKEQLSGV